MDPAWEPLPQRKKRDAKRPAVEMSLDPLIAVNPHATHGESQKEVAYEKHTARALENAARVDDAVAKRRSLVRAKPLDINSLSDGCYEHLDHTADVQCESFLATYSLYDVLWIQSMHGGRT